jgi:hypothetical protein
MTSGSRLAIVAIAILFGTASDCDDKAPTPTTGGTMTASVDGAFWDASRRITATYSGGALSITGESTTDITITISALPTGPGTYVIEGVNGAGLSFQVAQKPDPQTWQAYALYGSGTLQISVLSERRAAGTFSFQALPTVGTTAAGNKNVTSGTFDVLF